MSRHVKVLYGKISDEDSETAPSDHLSNKIYSAIGSATTIHSISLTKYGKIAIALVVFDD